LSNAVQDRLGAKSLKVVFVALDDFYYPQDHLRALKITHCNNVMLDGRGLPGTHDVALGARIMQELSEANDRPGQTIELPVYDKSKHAGLGDRSAETRPVAGPIDIIVFEGWCVGFHPLSPDALAAAYNSGRVPNEFAVFKSPPPGGVEQPVFKRHSLASLQEVNEFLGAYVDQLWSHLGALIQLVPEDMAYTYDWRLQVS
jgi:D-glycerate 3-kinase